MTPTPNYALYLAVSASVIAFTTAVALLAHATGRETIFWATVGALVAVVVAVGWVTGREEGGG